MIKLENISKSFVNKKIIKEVSLNIKKGEIYGLIGLSGAGKSTILRMINGLESPTYGKIEYTEEVKFGFVFQNFNLVNSLTVYENIELTLLNSSFTKKEKQKKVKEVLKLVGLNLYENVYPKSLSGGQKQRVGIARALVADINVLLCDEATSALDPFTANEIINLLKGLNKKLNLTIVFVSHQLELVKNFCDNIAIINEGKVCEVGTTLDVFSNPQSEESMKLLSGMLGFEELKKGQRRINCYSEEEINECLEKLVSNKVKIHMIYEHTTKQGIFAHLFVDKRADAEEILGDKYEIK